MVEDIHKNLVNELNIHSISLYAHEHTRAHTFPISHVHLIHITLAHSSFQI